ncbi:carbohydrate kinase family protein [Pseudoalteromonas sp. MMG005]|uniref:carbohydrate kinase family protein n=1 Tax=Pseudoalteromonas sp. MMG005 TaxID=2822682 RepID=UPI001B3A4F83|nr:carbohydrate kinase family protein [Pseudoalteromonas sp. MMG005]MBQ4844573.1 carbohydrate kinase family protein [Pseudoalteromonas sp. MMG005]
MKDGKALFARLNEFRKRIKVDSFTIAGVRLTFSGITEEANHFREIVNRIAKVNNKSHEVFVISAHNIDEIKLIDKISSDHECEIFGCPTKEPGGSGANSAYILALLGVDTAVAGAIGEDEDGQLLESSLRQAGVNTELLYRASHYPSGKTTTIVEESGKRLIAVSPGINNEFHALCSYEDILERASNAKIVHLSSFAGKSEIQLQEQLASEVKGKSIVSLTPGAIYSKKGLDRLNGLIKNVDLVFLYAEQLESLVNRSSAKSFLGGGGVCDFLEALYKWRGKKKHTSPLIVVVKDAFDGTMKHTTRRFLSVGVGVSELDSYMHPEELEPNVRLDMPDSTGAGDAAVAGFLVGMLNRASMESCIDAAFIMSSFASTRVGARTAYEEASGNIESLDSFSDNQSTAIKSEVNVEKNTLIRVDNN